MFDEIVAALIGSASAVVMYLVAFSVVWGRVKQQVENQGGDIEKLFSSIYKSNGTLVYVTEDLCKQKSKGMQQDLKEIKSDINEVRKTFQAFQEDYEKQSRELAFNIGQLLAKSKEK